MLDLEMAEFDLLNDDSAFFIATTCLVRIRDPAPFSGERDEGDAL